MYYEDVIIPQIADSNRYGHVDSLAAPQWFDRARTSLYFKMRDSLDFDRRGLVVVKLETSYLKEMNLAQDVLIRTWVSLIGTKSFETTQEALQGDELRVVEKTIFCVYDLQARRSVPIDDGLRALLEQYRWRLHK